MGEVKWEMGGTTLSSPAYGGKKRKLAAGDAASEFETAEELRQAVEFRQPETPVEAVEVMTALRDAHSGRTRGLRREFIQVIEAPIARRDE
jgi:hypothetical protein